MPRTGSTSIQRWLVENAAQLREREALHLLVATKREGSGSGHVVQLEPYARGNVNSGHIAYAWAVDQFRDSIPRRFLGELAELATRFGKVLISAEALCQFFWRRNETFLIGLDELAQTHAVRVAYYVRPQHTAIESYWREEGYKLPADPSDTIVRMEKELDYASTFDTVRAQAPHVHFDVRPFVASQLLGGTPVADFVRGVLGIDAASGDIHVNASLPIELVNLLRPAPDGLFWNGVRERFSRPKLRATIANLDLPPSEDIQRSREILQAYCHRVFEPGNQELIRALSWPLTEFVPTAEDPDDAMRLRQIDTLWSPKASPSELALFTRP